MRPVLHESHVDCGGYGLEKFARLPHLFLHYGEDVGIRDGGIKGIGENLLRIGDSHRYVYYKLVADKFFLLEHAVECMKTEVGKGYFKLHGRDRVSEDFAFHRDIACNWDFSHTTLMASAFECGGEVGVDYLLRFVDGYEACGEHEEVGVVVLTGKGSEFGQPAEGRTNALMFIESDLHALAGAAHAHSECTFTAFNGVGCGMAKVGVVA